MNEGFVPLFRKSLESRVFANEGLWKLWTWCLMKSSYREQWISVKTGRGFTEVHLLPGQFIFGRKTAAKELHMREPTVRARMLKLENMGNIITQSHTHYSVVTIVNWAFYQEAMKKASSKISTKYQPNITYKKEEKENKSIAPKIFSLKKRYPHPILIDQAFDAIRSTRKSKKVSHSVLLAQLERWEKYSVEQVESGIRTYLEKEYALQGKDEKYLLGIIRNEVGQEVQSSNPKPPYYRSLN